MHWMRCTASPASLRDCLRKCRMLCFVLCVCVCVHLCVRERASGVQPYTKALLLVVRGGLRGGGQSDWLRLLCLTLPILPVTEDVVTVAHSLSFSCSLSLESGGSSEDFRHTEICRLSNQSVTLQALMLKCRNHSSKHSNLSVSNCV